MQELDIQGWTLLWLALGLDAIIGDPRSKYHPVCLMGNFAYALEKFLRQGPNNFTMFLRGALAWLCVISLSCTAAIGLVSLAGLLAGNIGKYSICALILALCMAPKSLAQHAKNIIIPLNKNDLTTARQKLAMIVGRDVHSLDSHAIARAAIESVGENLVDGVLASLFWASVGLYFGYEVSAALVVLHRASNVLDAQWGKKNATYVRFGTCAARMDDMLNYIPARFSLICIYLAALIQKMYVQKTWYIIDKTELFRTAWRYRYAHASPNSAWSEAAFASALGLTLSGPVCYKGQAVQYPYIGHGTLHASTSHMEKALHLLWLSTFIWIFISGFIMLIFSLI